MRIISGIFKGKKILEPKDIKTRPLKDLTKESIFNILNHSNKFHIKLANSNILDLFSGVGSFGIECLSRSAESVVFIENYQNVLSILKKNLQNIKLFEKYKILEKDIYNLNTLSELNKKFEVIFLDPPYKDNKIKQLLINLKEAKVLNEKGIIILHRNKKDNPEFPEWVNILEEKKYGISKIFFFNFKL